MGYENNEKHVYSRIKIIALLAASLLNARSLELTEVTGHVLLSVPT